MYCKCRPESFCPIVGYQELNTPAVGNKMIAPTFVSVSSETSCTLADIKVTGYPALTYNTKTKKWQGGCQGGKFAVQILTSSGTCEAEYFWIDNGTLTPGWYADDVGTAIGGGASSVSIPAGMGLWTQGSGYVLNIPAPEL